VAARHANQIENAQNRDLNLHRIEQALADYYLGV